MINFHVESFLIRCCFNDAQAKVIKRPKHWIFFKQSLDLLIKAIKCLTQVDNFNPNFLECRATNLCFHNHAYVEIIDQFIVCLQIVACCSILSTQSYIFIKLTCDVLIWIILAWYSIVAVSSKVNIHTSICWAMSTLMGLNFGLLIYSHVLLGLCGD